MSKKYGGISIFLAVTFLSLIVFVMSIVEVTRYQILRAQAERMVISATQSVLAGYDSALKNEYGIFARNPAYGDCFFVMPDLEKTTDKAMAMDFNYYLGENVKQTSDQLHMSLVDRYVFRYEDDAYYELTPLTLVSSTIASEKTLVDTATKDLSYVKQDMVDYMELRLPLIGLSTISCQRSSITIMLISRAIISEWHLSTHFNQLCLISARTKLQAVLFP